MSEIPPVQYAAYPRGADALDLEAADRLQALFDGYMGLSWVLVLNMLLTIGWVVSMNVDIRFAPLLAVIAMVVLIALMSYRYNKMIGYGLRWSPAAGIVISIVMGLNSPICAGIIGYALVQTRAAEGMRRAGVRRKWHGGYVQKDLQARIAELRAISSSAELAASERPRA